MNFKSLLGVILVASISFSANAEKIAVLGVQQALLASSAAADFREKLKSEFSKEDRSLLDLEKQVKAARDKITKTKI